MGLVVPAGNALRLRGVQWTPSPHPWIIDAHAPTYVLELPESATYEEMEAFLNLRREFLRKLTHSFGLVSDASNVGRVEPRVRLLLSEADARDREFSNRWLRVWAFVIRTQIQRLALTAYLWFNTPPCEHSVFTSREEALDWVRNRLAKHMDSL